MYLSVNGVNVLSLLEKICMKRYWPAMLATKKLVGATLRGELGIHHCKRQSMQVGGSTLTLKLRPDIDRIPKPSISCPAKLIVVVHFLLLSMERTSCCSNSAALICWARTLITVPDLILCPLYLCLTYVYDIPDNFPFLANCGCVAFAVNERSRMCSFFVQ